MKTSENGIKMIKDFEGYCATPYRATASEKYMTIGFGHYGEDVKDGMRLSKEEAESLLKKDLIRFENAVNNMGKADGKQNAFDALVSFAYNCGEGNLSKLCSSRSLDEISEKIKLYNKAGGVVLNGLVRRREKESEMIKKDLNVKKPMLHDGCFPACGQSYESIVDALKSVGAVSTFDYRKKIASSNGMTGYKGSMEQNITLLRWLKKGVLKRPCM